MAKKKKEKSFWIKTAWRTGGLLLMMWTVSLWLSCLFYHETDVSANMASSLPVQNLLGLYGAANADFILTWLGAALPVFLIAWFVWGYGFVRLQGLIRPYWRMFAWLVGTVSLAITCSLLLPLDDFKTGGNIGYFLARQFMTLFNRFYVYDYGRYILGAVFGIIALLGFNLACGITQGAWYRALKKACLVAAAGAAMLWSGLKSFAALFKRSAVKEPETRKKREPRLRREPKLQEEELPARPAIKENKDNKEKESRPAAKNRKNDDGYRYPDINLLGVNKDKHNAVSQKELEKVAQDLEGVLQEFGVNGKIVNIRPGPVVTLYELEPAPGTKTARVIGLADDIARSMSVISVRIAVVPGCNTIGIELPNKNRETVWLRDLFEDPDFMNSKNELNVVLGKDIGGKDVYADLSKMPHLLVAGTTGSGKSVGVNSMILSLLFRMRPEECKLIMIDPKMLEFSMYNGIPHLLTPVITDPAKAVVGLKWAVKEMEDRYRAMAQLNVRNIAGYNQKLAELRASGKSVKRTVQTGFDSETGKPIYEEQELDLTRLPYIVIVVDEMADLMLVAGKEVEAAIQRLAQMARAAGFHLIMSTQRPSVDVITGTIKANFPTRISFQVTSKIDSRTILGEQGAEQLLGKGDMLYMPAGLRPIRIHGAFASDAEIEGVVEFIKSQKAPEYVEAVTAGELNEKDSGAVFDKGEFGGNGDDDLYAQAVAIVQQDKKASTSYIQRKLRIGYNRAASLIDRMEQEGLISAADHVGRREVL